MLAATRIASLRTSTAISAAPPQGCLTITDQLHDIQALTRAGNRMSWAARCNTLHAMSPLADAKHGVSGSIDHDFGFEQATVKSQRHQFDDGVVAVKRYGAVCE